MYKTLTGPKINCDKYISKGVGHVEESHIPRFLHLNEPTTSHMWSSMNLFKEDSCSVLYWLFTYWL